jgi:hypothetical protein
MPSFSGRATDRPGAATDRAAGLLQRVEDHIAARESGSLYPMALSNFSMRMGRTRNRDRRRRPFTALDALILAVSVFGGFVAAWWLDSAFFEMLWVYRSHSPVWSWLPRWVGDLELPAQRVQFGVVPFLAVVSLGVALASFRTLRIDVQRLWRSPGLAATAVIAATILVYTAVTALEVWRAQTWRNLSPTFWNNTLAFLALNVTATLESVWCYMAVARLWRPRSGWRDWLGRWLGGVWLATLGTSALFLVLWG